MAPWELASGGGGRLPWPLLWWGRRPWMSRLHPSLWPRPVPFWAGLVPCWESPDEHECCPGRVTVQELRMEFLGRAFCCLPHPQPPVPLRQPSPTFLAPQTSFMEDNLPMVLGVGGCFGFHPPLTSCCAACFLTGHGPAPRGWGHIIPFYRCG